MEEGGGGGMEMKRKEASGGERFMLEIRQVKESLLSYHFQLVSHPGGVAGESKSESEAD